MSANSQPAHSVQFFAQDRDLVDEVGRFACQSIASGSTLLLIGTAEHRRLLQEELTDAGLDVGRLVADYQYIVLDAHLTLSSFMLDGHPDRERFHRIMGLLIHQAASRGYPVRIFGEMVALLAANGQVSSALQLEELWNELSRQHDFTLFCAYMAGDVDDASTRRRICSLHSWHPDLPKSN